VRQAPPAGWTQSAPSNNAGITVNLAAGAFVDTVLFGAHTANSTRHYANNTAVKTSAGKPNAVSMLNVSDAYTIFDLKLTVNVSNPKNKSLSVKLTGPDGTVVSFGTSANGTVTFETPAFNYKRVTGKWTLEVDGLAGGTLNNWSMDILGSLS
jgi:subtilisin-like proprotein convertase family protein